MGSKSEDFEVGQSREGASRDRDSAPLARGNAVMIEAVLRAFIAEDYHEGRREAGRFALAALEEMERQFDDYVAWLRYKQYGDRTCLVVCDSDEPGAFRVFRAPA